MSAILHIEKMSLSDLLSIWSYGFNKNCIYIIKYEHIPCYVGKTVNGVTVRIRQHMAENSPIGIELKKYKPSYVGWNTEVWFVSSDIFGMERYAIQTFKPLLNKQKHRR